MINLFGNSTDSQSLGNQFRKRRFKFLESKLLRLVHEKSANQNRQAIIRILDLGGLEQYWANMGMANHPNIHITLLNLTEVRTTYSNITSISGDATNLNEFETRSFDLVFSNSVIEHLYNFRKC